MKIRRSIVGQTNVCCNRYSDGTIFVGALTDFMHRSVKSRVAKSPRTQTHPPTATVEVSPCVFLDGDPYERLTNMAQQARANEAQFLDAPDSAG